MSKYIEKMDWNKLISEIIQLEPDPEVNWTYASIGKAVGTSRSTIGRLLMDPERDQYLDDPKFAQGMALIRIHREIREKIAATKAEEAEQ